MLIFKYEDLIPFIILHMYRSLNILVGRSHTLLTSETLLKSEGILL